jgi:AraC-like DNA-binding protein
MFDRYKPLLGSSIQWVLEEHGARAYLFCDPVFYHPQITRIAFEAWLGAVMSFTRTWLPMDDSLSEVWFKHERPEYHAQYARVFTGTLRFGQPRYAIVGPREYLDRELVLADATTRAALEAGAEQLLQGMQAGTTAERVRALLWFERRLDAMSTGKIAKGMGLGVRELRRRLAAEGVRLSQLLGEARLRVAKHELSKPGVSIKEAAYALGFSEPSAFFRAFKRWSGQTPLEYLRQLQHTSHSNRAR